MRPIDADALITQMEERQAFLVKEWGHRDHYTSGYEEAVERVAAAPTIEQAEQRACADGDYLNRETVVNNVLSQLAVSQNPAAMRERIMNLQGISIEQPQWISVDDRLPTEEDSNEYDCVLAVKENYGERLVDSWHYKTVCVHMKDFSYWMPFSFLPEPPRGIKDDNI